MDSDPVLIEVVRNELGKAAANVNACRALGGVPTLQDLSLFKLVHMRNYEQTVRSLLQESGLGHAAKNFEGMVGLVPSTYCALFHVEIVLRLPPTQQFYVSECRYVTNVEKRTSSCAGALGTMKVVVHEEILRNVTLSDRYYISFYTTSPMDRPILLDLLSESVHSGIINSSLIAPAACKTEPVMCDITARVFSRVSLEKPFKKLYSLNIQNPVDENSCLYPRKCTVDIRDTGTFMSTVANSLTGVLKDVTNASKVFLEFACVQKPQKMASL